MKQIGGTGTGQGRVTFTWNGDKAAEAVRAGAWDGLVKAGEVLYESMAKTVGIKGGFGNRSKPGEPPRVDRNKLVRSLGSHPDPAARVVRVGSNDPEGRWMEFGPPGGIIRPKRVKYLPVPLNKKAADLLHKLAGASLKGQSLKYMTSNAGNKLLMETTKTGKIKKNGAVFILKEQIKLAPRPWVWRSYKAAQKDMNAVFHEAIRRSIRGLAKK